MNCTNRILDFSKLIPSDTPAQLPKQAWHGRSVCHVTRHRFGDVDVLQARDFFDWGETGNTPDATARGAEQVA